MGVKQNEEEVLVVQVVEATLLHGLVGITAVTVIPLLRAVVREARDHRLPFEEITDNVVVIADRGLHLRYQCTGDHVAQAAAARGDRTVYPPVEVIIVTKEVIVDLIHLIDADRDLAATVDMTDIKKENLSLEVLVVIVMNHRDLSIVAVVPQESSLDLTIVQAAADLFQSVP